MVDRLINKVESQRPDFERVESSTETKKDKRHDQQTAEEKAEKFSRNNKANENWEKYGAKRITIKPLKVQRSQISKIIYKRAIWTKGNAMLLVDVKWINGTLTENAVMRLKSMNEYMRARSFAQGADVPEDLWASDTIEIGIPTVTGSSGIHSMEELEKGIIDHEEKPKKFFWDVFNWEHIIIALIGISLFVLILIYALRG